MAQVGRIEIVKAWGTEYTGDGARQRAERSAQAAVQRRMQESGMTPRGVVTILETKERRMHSENAWCYQSQAMGRAVRK